jgi:cation transport ATPase
MKLRNWKGSLNNAGGTFSGEEMVMGLLDLFSPKKIGELATSAVKGLDDVVYTNQEKAEKTEAAQKLYAELWKAASPSALSRRIIAAIMISVWAFLIVFGVVVYPFHEPLSEFAFTVLQEIVLQPVNIIVGFYFLKSIVTEYRNGDSK